MIGIVISTHSTFADGLKNACEMIAGKQINFESVCFMGDEDLLELGERIKAIGEKYEDGCIYVVDLVNATPFNASLLAIAGTENVILVGASLPMVLELLIKRVDYEGSCEELAQEIIQSSVDYVGMKHSRDVFQ